MVSPLSLTGLEHENLLRRCHRILLTDCVIGTAIGGSVGLIGLSNTLQDARPRSCTSIAVIQQTFLSSSRNESAGRNLMSLPTVERAAPPMIYSVIDLPVVNTPVFASRVGCHEFQSLESIAISGWASGGDVGRSILGELEQEAGSYSVGDAVS